jgi:hypothetical protein
VPKTKKDTQGGKVDQWADTKDPFVNMIYKKLRNKKKKLDKIKETEDKVKKGEIKPNQEQVDMIKSKEGLLEEMKQQQEIIKMYQEAFPDNPAFATSSKKKKE